MRIRKHAKISQLLDAASPLHDGAVPVLQTYVCQLNQSPWDAMNFSPPSSPPPRPPPQVDGGDACGRDGGSDHCISVAESKNMPKIDANENEFVGDATAVDKEAAKEQCCKTDGKSWRCRREAAAGSSLCDHHLSLVKNYQNLTHNSTKKSENSTVESRRSTRSKMESWSLGSSHEFYYYSGFRPGWSKKRSGPTSNSPVGSRVPRKVDSEREKLNHEELIDSEEEGEGEVDDDDNNDEECQDVGIPATTAAAGKKKRARKPVKARSLKSLM